jgi:RimJ/RimL family protein N-acetyltransferase
MAEFRLETDRLIVRDWRPEDWPVYLAHTNTPAVMRWLGGVSDGSAQEAGRARLEACRREHGHALWVVERKRDGGHLAGELLGFCGLKRANLAGSPIGDFEIGWRFREDSWGCGYARESAERVMSAAFEVFDAPHVIALTVKGNVASWGLMRRLGMRRRPEQDFTSADAREGPTIVYSITRDEWAGQ